MAGQSNCNFLFTVKLDFKDMLAFLFLNRMIQCLIIICLFTSITLLRLIRKKKKKKKKEGRKYRSSEVHNRYMHARAHTHRPLTFILAGFMSCSVKAINKPVFPAVCLPVQALKKN